MAFKKRKGQRKGNGEPALPKKQCVEEPSKYKTWCGCGCGRRRDNERAARRPGTMVTHWACSHCCTATSVSHRRNLEHALNLLEVENARLREEATKVARDLKKARALEQDFVVRALPTPPNMQMYIACGLHCLHYILCPPPPTETGVRSDARVPGRASLHVATSVRRVSDAG
jgi:hypothetical protein